jgi:hypothetical protein
VYVSGQHKEQVVGVNYRLATKVIRVPKTSATTNLFKIDPDWKINSGTRTIRTNINHTVKSINPMLLRKPSFLLDNVCDSRG